MDFDRRLIASAFKYGRDSVQGRAFPAGEVIAQYVRDHSNDRRFTLHFLAASSSFRTATVRYRGVKYSVNHHYPTDTWTVLPFSN